VRRRSQPFGSGSREPTTLYSRGHARGYARAWLRTRVATYACGYLRAWLPTHVATYARGYLRAWLQQTADALTFQYDSWKCAQSRSVQPITGVSIPIVAVRTYREYSREHFAKLQSVTSLSSSVYCHAYVRALLTRPDTLHHRHRRSRTHARATALKRSMPHADASQGSCA
jgi:hypothetical protein